MDVVDPQLQRVKENLMRQGLTEEDLRRITEWTVDSTGLPLHANKWLQWQILGSLQRGINLGILARKS